MILELKSRIINENKKLNFEKKEIKKEQKWTR